MEQLEIFDLDDKFLGTQERKEFYADIKKEFKEKGKISRQVKSVRMLIMTSEGRIYIQRRSKRKKENPGLYDKTIGGHVKAGHTWKLTVVQECHEELGFPAVILTDDEFIKALSGTDLRIIGLLRKVDHISQFISVRKTKEGDSFEQPYINNFYIGYYDGGIRFCDGESSGIEVFTIEELEKQIAEEPTKFTEDLKWMIKRYRHLLVPLNTKKGPTYAFKK
jgi:isopentenyldiphosphate isomerase